MSLEPIMAERTEDETRAFEKVTRLACTRERGSRELADRLVRDGFSREVAESAVRRALDCGLIDDTRYGAVLIRTRVSQGRGRKGIEDELERAGIAASDIPGWPEEFFSVDDFDPFRVNANAEDGVVGCSFGSESSDEQEIERALALLRRKPPRSKNIQASAYRKLVTKGYSTSVASAATRRFMEEN
ncbi:MAG: regulatory protein RecX [Slackia sp.]|nr:regulatory protein RecX [Slackia sp.]